MYLQGNNFSEISREVKTSRATVRKYVNEYLELEAKLESAEDIKTKEEIIELANQKPTYDASNRSKYIYTHDIDLLVDYYLEQNEIKRKKKQFKMLMKNVDIHREINKIYPISYSTINNAIKNKLNKTKETYIKSEHAPGNVCEFDWGDVTLIIDEFSSEERRYKIGVFALKYSNYVYSNLYANETTDCFKDIHSEYFEHIKGVPKVVVYDNARVQVRRLSGSNSKAPTKALSSLMNYYGFKHRFTNDYSGNEKGTVERYVEYVRRRAFSRNNHFKTFEDARNQLYQTIEEINTEVKQRKEEVPLTMLAEEKDNFLAKRIPYDPGMDLRVKVNKYSLIYVDSCFYSVPEFLTEKEIRIKKYPLYIKILYNDKVIEIIQRIWKKYEYKININHYLKTLKKKPGSLVDSLALKQAETKLQKIFHRYFSTNPKDFIVFLELLNEYPEQAVFAAIGKLEDARIEINTRTIKCQLIEPSMLYEEKIIQKDISEDCNSHINNIASLFNQTDKEAIING